MSKLFGVLLGDDGSVVEINDDLLMPVGSPLPEGLGAPEFQSYLALVLAHEIGGSVVEARAAIWMVHGAVVVRDGGEVRGVWVVPGARIADELDLTFTGVLVNANGEVINSGTGAATYGHPASALLAVAKGLADAGEDAHADVVLAPALTAPIAVTTGLAYGFEFNDGLGSIHIAC